MDKGFYRDLLLQEELLNKKFIFLKEEIKAQIKDSILIQEEYETILGLGENNNTKNLVMYESSYKLLI